jgi:hypothetical protein
MFLFAFIAVLALIGVAAWLVRRFATNRLGANPGRGRMPRLAVIDAAAQPSEFDGALTTEPTICRQSYGDVAVAFKDAAAIVELDLSVGRHSGVPLETRGAIGRYDAARDVLELHGAAKVPHKNRETLARMLGRSTAGRTERSDSSAARTVFGCTCSSAAIVPIFQCSA